MCGKKQFPTSELPLFFLVAGPVLGAILFFTLKSLGWGSDACWTAAVSAVCAVWWIFEPVPIPVTSLLPFALFPILGVLSPREISESYGAPLNIAPSRRIHTVDGNGGQRSPQAHSAHHG